MLKLKKISLIFKKTLLEELVTECFARRRGHTYATIKGIESCDNAILIVKDGVQQNIMELPSNKTKCISEIPSLIGSQKAIVVDHDALQTLFQKHMETFLETDIEPWLRKNGWKK